MQTLREGDRGQRVRNWQLFLIGQGFDPGVADGDFGPRTTAATVAFQEKHGLVADGVVGNRSFGQAMLLGFPAVTDTEIDRASANWPPKPAGLTPLVTTADRQRLFGRFSFRSRPVPGNRENIDILGDWEGQNIVRVEIPQLVGVRGAPGSGVVRFHRLAADQLRALWAAWGEADLLDRVDTWDGSFVPRFVRGSRRTLSNHAFGTAFDVNAATNPLGALPPLVGRPGCVRELAEIAHRHGFYWGGHFTRRDGMHFEIARLL